MEVYTSDSSDSDSREQKSLDYGHLNVTTEFLEDDFTNLYQTKKAAEDIETIQLNHNRLRHVPLSIIKFNNLKVLDLSSNSLTSLPESLLLHCPLSSLIVKNNLLTNKSLPKSFQLKHGCLKELNLSGNKLKHFPEQIIELKQLKYLYLGGNQIKTISKEIWKLQK